MQSQDRMIDCAVEYLAALPEAISRARENVPQEAREVMTAGARLGTALTFDQRLEVRKASAARVFATDKEAARRWINAATAVKNTETVQELLEHCRSVDANLTQLVKEQRETREAIHRLASALSDTCLPRQSGHERPTDEVGESEWTCLDIEGEECRSTASKHSPRARGARTRKPGIAAAPASAPADAGTRLQVPLSDSSEEIRMH